MTFKVKDGLSLGQNTIIDASGNITAPGALNANQTGGVNVAGTSSGATKIVATATPSNTLTLPAITGTIALTSDLPVVNNGTLTLASSGNGISGSGSFTANQSGNTTVTFTQNATNVNTPSTIVYRDASGNFSAGTITATLNGNASTVTNGVYTNGQYADPAWITQINYNKLTGTIPTWNQNTTGNAATATRMTVNSATDANAVRSNALELLSNTVGSTNFPATSGITVEGRRATGSTAATGTFQLFSDGTESYQIRTVTGYTTSDTWSSWKILLHSGNFNTYSPTLTGTGASGTWNISISGSAPTLTTARTINGTSFDGSANITTNSWGTARTITIGSTGKSVDGSAAISWSLAELGAAAVGQTMFIGTTSLAINRASAAQALTGITSIDGNAATATTLQTSRTINGTSFNGSIDITTNSWGTARTITLGQTGKSVDGSAAVSWSLAEMGAAAVGQTTYVGTTAITLNRASAAQALTGITSIDGNAATATALQTARTIGGVSFNGTANIVPLYSASYGDIAINSGNRTVSAAGTGLFTYGYAASTVGAPSTKAGEIVSFGNGASGGHAEISVSYNGIPEISVRSLRDTTDNWSSWVTVLTSSNYNSYSPTLTGTGASGTWGINVTGNAATATVLQTARNLWGQTFNGSADISGALTGVAAISMSGQLTNTVTTGTAPFVVSSTTKVTNLNADLLDDMTTATTNTASTIVNRDASGNFSAGTITASLSGNATTATTLQTARTINGTSFNGSANITTNSWGTARTLTLGGTGKSVDGSANVSWTIPELLSGASQIQQSGHNTTWGTTNTTSTGALNAIMGTAANATWLLSGTSGGVFRAGIQALDSDGTLRFYQGTNFFQFGSNTLTATSFSGALTGNASTATTLQTARTVTVGLTGKSFNGASDVSWQLTEIGAEAAANKGVANGYASLDAGGKVPTAQLPAYVDDVLEYANLAGFPATGETGKIYVALDTNKTYRWSGTVYVYITSGAVDSVAGKTGVVTLVKADVGLGNVDNTADVNKQVSSAATLTTARTINGTSFNGSANITTNSWGTARTLTLGSSGKSVDGSVAVSWSLAEMGAAAVGQTMFVGTTSLAINRTSAAQALTGITSIDGSASTLTTARNINGTLFNGSADITTANWGTQRTFTIGASAQAVNGSSNMTWTLPQIGARHEQQDQTSVISTNTSATVGMTYIITQSCVLTLPAAPVAGNWIRISNVSNTSTITIARNGLNIMGLAEDLIIDSNYAALTLLYSNATYGWVLA